MTPTIILVTSALLFLFVLPTHAHHVPCDESFAKYAENLTHCKTLSTLGAEFAWEVDKFNETRVTVMFGAKLKFDSGWLAWGVNPGETPQMVGTRAVIGIRQENGTLFSGTYNITKEVKSGCTLLPSKIDVDVVNTTFKYDDRSDLFILQATFVLPPSYNISKLNHVWQIGYDSDGVQPKMHPGFLQNFDSSETIDLRSGNGIHAGQSRMKLRVVHGILNIIGWGIFLPLGVVIARYFRFPIQTKPVSLWYYLHVGCQTTGYTTGTVGWIIGLWLGHASKHYTFHLHRLLGILVFSFATLQMLALQFKPGKDDPIRKNWNVYHYFLGYSLLALIIVNIFEGIKNLKPNNMAWRWSYIAILTGFALIFGSFEIFSWYRFIHPKRDDKNKQKEAESVQPVLSPTPSVSVHQDSGTRQ